MDVQANFSAKISPPQLKILCSLRRIDVFGTTRQRLKPNNIKCNTNWSLLCSLQFQTKFWTKSVTNFKLKSCRFKKDPAIQTVLDISSCKHLLQQHEPEGYCGLRHTVRSRSSPLGIRDGGGRSSGPGRRARRRSLGLRMCEAHWMWSSASPCPQMPWSMSLHSLQSPLWKWQ